MQNSRYSAKLNKIIPAVSSGIILSAVAAVFYGIWSPPPALAIGLGFIGIFILPGWLLGRLILPDSRFHPLEYYPLSLALSLGLFALQGLAAFHLELPLNVVLALYASATFLLWIFYILRKHPVKHDESLDRVSLTVVSILTLGTGLLAFFTGAFRGPALDWDYFSYISYVVRLLDLDAASNAHFAYQGAPTDPIHSYNIWALNWTLSARAINISPISLYLGSAFMTIPAAILAFFSMARRMLSSGPALAAIVLFVAYQVIYGGLLFVGRTTFYPEDAMWLLVFPMCISMLIEYIERGGPGLLVCLCLSVLGMSIVHVMWGLAFYMSAAFLITARAIGPAGLLKAAKQAWQDEKALPAAALALLLLPGILAMAWVVNILLQDSPDWFTPLLPSFKFDSVWLWSLVLGVLPLTLTGVWLRRSLATVGSELLSEQVTKRVLTVMGLALLISLPYVTLRAGAVGNTVWAQFGHNPYRGFITESLFLLNPFQRSLFNPNMTFYPVCFLGLAGLGLLWRQAREKTGPRLALAVFLGVLLLVFHPVSATLFSEFFSLGYLRRILRLFAIMSFIPAGLALAWLVEKLANFEKRPLLYALSVTGLAAGIALVSIPFPAKPLYYNDMFKKMLTITREAPRDSLIFDETPFTVLADLDLAAQGEVIFSDFWTSYRITAYLPVYVAARQKPGVGVPDQDQRELHESEFFNPATPIERMREILDYYRAGIVIVNRNPHYRLYTYPCGHPEAIGKLSQDTAHFHKQYDRGDWAIFSYNLNN